MIKKETETKRLLRKYNDFNSWAQISFTAFVAAVIGLILVWVAIYTNTNTNISNQTQLCTMKNIMIVVAIILFPIPILFKYWADKLYNNTKIKMPLWCKIIIFSSIILFLLIILFYWIRVGWKT